MAFNHPVGRRPHPKRPRGALALRPLGLILTAGPHGDAPVPQRHKPLRGCSNQLGLHHRIGHRGLRDQVRGPSRQCSGPYRRIRLRQRLEPGGRLDRPLRFTGAHAGQSLAQLRRVSIGPVGMCRSVLDPLRGLPQHAIEQTTLDPELLDQVDCILATARARIEAACCGFECLP
jgi:hypothetical protein